MKCEVCEEISNMPSTYYENKKYIIGCDANNRVVVIFKAHSLHVLWTDMYEVCKHMYDDSHLRFVPMVRGEHVVLSEA